jgi:hypothetical protein
VSCWWWERKEIVAAFDEKEPWAIDLTVAGYLISRWLLVG